MRRLPAALLLGFAFTAHATPRAAETDPETGLLIAPGWQLVAALCTQCHSTALITQQKADRRTWLEMIRWMQRTQNLWPLPPDTETALLDYLERAYGPVPSRRRAPLPRELMPPID